MADETITIAAPPRRKVNWSRSQESYYNSETVTDPRDIKDSKINLLGNSLDSKLEHCALNKQGICDVDEDGRPLLARHSLHLSQNRTQQPDKLRRINTRDPESTNWQKETDLSKHFLSSVWQKHESGKYLGSGKQTESGCCSWSSDSCEPSDINSENTINNLAKFTGSDKSKVSAMNRELGGNSMFKVKFTMQIFHNADNEEVNSSGKTTLSMDKENGWHQTPCNETTINENDITNTEHDAGGSQRNGGFLPYFVPEIPPGQPLDQSENDHNIRKYTNWNADHFLKAEAFYQPRVISMTVLCGNCQSVSHAVKFSSHNNNETLSNKELYHEHKRDFGFDAGDENTRVWLGNHAYDPTDREGNGYFTFDSSTQTSDNDVHHSHSVSWNEKGRRAVYGNSNSEHMNETPTTQSSQLQYFGKSNYVSNNTLNNEMFDSDNIVKIENEQRFLSINSFSSSIKPQGIQSHGGSVAAENQPGGSNKSMSERDTQYNTGESFSHDHHASDVQQTCENFEHEEWVNSSESYESFDSTNSSEHIWNTNKNGTEQISCTFEKANEPWSMQSDRAESSQYDPYSSGMEYKQNLIPDEIQNFPVSSKTLSVPHPPGQPQSNNLDTASSQNSIHYDHQAENTFDTKRGHREHVHQMASPTTCYDDSAGTLQNENQHFSESFVSNQSGCGNCCNCRASEMMDTMKALAQSAGFIIHDVLPDGNCMFRSVVDQLRMHGDLDTTAGDLRMHAVEYLTNNPCSEDGTHMKDFLLTETWEQYLERMKKDGEWGDEIALRGISEVLQRKICIISAVGKHHNQITIHPSSVETDQSEDLFLGHLNDSHYLSLRSSDWLDKWFVSARKVKERKRRDTVNLANDTADAKRTTGQTKEILISNKETEKQLLYQEKLIDSLSTTPLPHLSYVMRNVINLKFLIPANIDANSSVESNIASRSIFVGIHAEKLEIILSDPLGVRSSTQRRKITSPIVLLEMSNFLVIKARQVENNAMNYLIIDEANVHPGYLRLHPASHSHNNDGYRNFDENICLSQSNLTGGNVEMRVHSSYNDDRELPNVTYCFRCKVWPDSAVEFQSRKRPSGWPEKQCILQAINQGCLVIAEAHPQSTKPEVEFMYSFGEAEAIFALSFGKYQKYCFHVFRLLVKLVTKGIPLLGTYHIKTIFFYASEVIPRRYWEINPGACLLYLISRLLSCLHCRVLPHYFIKENNLIDSFDDVSLSKLVERIGSVREFPIMTLILLAEEHGLSSSWMADAIIKEMEHFLIDHDLQRSFTQAFVPTSLKIVESFVRYNMYNDAAEVVRENYDHAKTLNIVYKISPVKPMFYFILPVLTQLNLYQKWWLCFFIDMKCDESTLPLLTEKEEGRTIADIVGEKNKGELGHVLVPYQVLSQQTCPHACSVVEDSSDIEINFLVYLTFHLATIEKHEVCSHYQRYLVQLIKDKIEENASLPATSLKHDDTRWRKSGTKNNHEKITFLYQQLYHTLIRLFHSYDLVGQPELFQEFIHDLESICDTIATKSCYQNLSNIWQTLGSHEMSKLALAKKQNLTHYH